MSQEQKASTACSDSVLRGDADLADIAVFQLAGLELEPVRKSEPSKKLVEYCKELIKRLVNAVDRENTDRLKQSNAVLKTLLSQIFSGAMPELVDKWSPELVDFLRKAHMLSQKSSLPRPDRRTPVPKEMIDLLDQAIFEMVLYQQKRDKKNADRKPPSFANLLALVTVLVLERFPAYADKGCSSAPSTKCGGGGEGEPSGPLLGPVEASIAFVLDRPMDVHEKAALLFALAKVAKEDNLSPWDNPSSDINGTLADIVMNHEMDHDEKAGLLVLIFA